MTILPKMRAIVALLAAYALVLQTTLLAIGGPLAGSAGIAPGSLCSRLGGAPAHSAPGGNEHGCLAACTACCCGASVVPASAPAPAFRWSPPQRIAVKIAIGFGIPRPVACAHRSRAPPLG
jgi:hypothetical protein